MCTEENTKKKIKQQMRYSYHIEFCGERWDYSLGHHVLEIMAWCVNLNFLTASFVVLIFGCSAELALPDAGCSLSITGRKCCTRRVETVTLAAGALARGDNFLNGMRQHGLYIM